MKKLRVAAALPVLLALTLAVFFHQSASASQSRPTHFDAEQTTVRTNTWLPQFDIEGVAAWCTNGLTTCRGNSPFQAGFYECGADNSGCTEAWADADGPTNGNRAGRPASLSAGCGTSYIDGNNVMHFKYASLDTSSSIVGAGLIVGDTGDKYVDTQAFLNVSASGLSTSGNGISYATTVKAVTQRNNQESLAHIQNGGDRLLAGGFKVTFTGVIDQTISGESGSGNQVESYQPNGTITCTIDHANNNFRNDFDAEVE